MCLPKRFSEDCSWKKKRSQGNVCDENNDKRVNINHPEEAAGFWQLFPFLFCSSLSLPYPLHNSSQIIAVKNSRYRKNIGEIRQYYEVQHQNWYVIDGFHSKWWIWNEVIKKVKMVNKYMQIYMERIKQRGGGNICNIQYTACLFIELTAMGIKTFVYGNKSKDME